MPNRQFTLLLSLSTDLLASFLLKRSACIYFWSCWVLTAGRPLFTCSESGLFSSCGALTSPCSGLLLHAPCSCSPEALRPQVHAVVPHRLTRFHSTQGSSQIRDPTHVSYQGSPSLGFFSSCMSVFPVFIISGKGTYLLLFVFNFQVSFLKYYTYLSK